MARQAGLTDDEVRDVGAITALFAMANRLAHLTGCGPGLGCGDEFCNTMA